LQCGIAGVLVAIPLLHPEALPMLVDAPRLVVPAPTPPPPPVRVETAAVASSTEAMSLPAVSAAPAALAPSLLTGISIADPGPAPAMGTGLPLGMGMPSNLLAVVRTGSGTGIPVARATPGKVRVSSGVSTGLLLTQIQPVYPAIAKAAGVQGTVVMEAVISKTGRIESLRAVSGPAMLRPAALEAVQAARYQPYKLNGEATEVETTITVNFRLGS
jgi:periplasmic protein TonB